MGTILAAVFACLIGVWLLGLLIAALKGFTIHQYLWLMRDAWRDPVKWLRPRDEHGRLRPTRKENER